MNIKDVKELMDRFDSSSLREFSYQNGATALRFSKNEDALPIQPELATAPVAEIVPPAAPQEEVSAEPVVVVEGELVESPLVGVAYLSPSPDKPAFVSVGDRVQKGQTLLIVEAMKIMNEIPSPKDGVVTEVLVDNEEVVEFGKGLVRIK